MPRKPRIVIPGQPLHVLQRGNNRQAIFFAGEDYRVFLAALEAACETYGCEVHAYVLMTNHVHLLMTPAERDSLSLVMQSVGRRYVRYVNDTYRRSGTLWEGRFKCSLIDTVNYLLACFVYIEMNPVRAGMVEVLEILGRLLRFRSVEGPDLDAEARVFRFRSADPSRSRFQNPERVDQLSCSNTAWRIELRAVLSGSGSPSVG